MFRSKSILRVGACVAALLFDGCARHDDRPSAGTAVSSPSAPAPDASGPGMHPVTFRSAEEMIAIDNFSYSPSELTVPVGTTITWINRDDVPHTVTSDGGKGPLLSTALDTDDKYSYRFSKAGEYPYFCKVHPHMTGRITVR
jgi:plastocyanin